MTYLRNAIFILLFCATSAFAEPASEDSIKQLLSITESRQLVNGMMSQLNTMMASIIKQATAGQQATAEQQKAVASYQNKITALMQQELSWEKLEPMYIRMYQTTFSKEEVNGMLQFYRTPAGQAVIHKMPVLMQKIMPEAQRMLTGMLPKMQQIQKEFMNDLKSVK